MQQVNSFVNLRFFSVRAYPGARPAILEACKLRGESEPAREACPEAGGVLCDPSDISSANGRLAKLAAELAAALPTLTVRIGCDCSMFEPEH